MFTLKHFFLLNFHCLTYSALYPSFETQVHTNPLPFSVTSAGAVYLTEMAGTNLHLSSLLLALSRSPGDGRGGDWYSPVKQIHPLHH